MFISISNVWKIYKEGSQDVIALKEINLKIKKGEYIAITGPSGSGKSTLLHVLGCLDIPTKGEYRLDGRRVDGLSEREIANIRNLRIGFVFQFFNLLPRINILQNVGVPLFYSGIKKEERDEKAYEALKKVDMVHRALHLPNELSGGEKQRAAIARAVVNDPDITLADEPTGNLDTNTGNHILNLFDSFNKKGKTIIIVSHDSRIAERAERVVILQDGIIKDEMKRKR
ncbi:ABC transporter ATP-binding protein [candidate division WOR-3 bacterium]|nr:ABC transporter ATP-binding protein [candidate division WOR-3 bacterium]